MENSNKMTIAVVQIYDDNIKDYAIYSQIINSLYCEKQNYIYLSWNYDLVPTYMSIYYNKILAVLKAFGANRHIDWVLYIDSDACVTKQDIKIEDIIARHPDKELIMGRDINGTNNGVFLIKNTESMKQYLNNCLIDKRYFHTNFPEQSAMLNNIKMDDIGWENMMFFNAYFNVYNDFKQVEHYFDDNSFILHLARISNEQRKKVLLSVLKNKQLFYFEKESEK